MKSAELQVDAATGKEEMVVRRYLEDFPFKHYCVVKVSRLILERGLGNKGTSRSASEHICAMALSNNAIKQNDFH